LWILLMASGFWMLYLAVLLCCQTVLVTPSLFAAPLVFVGLTTMFIFRKQPPFVGTGATPTVVSVVRSGLAYGIYGYVFVESVSGPLLINYYLSRSLYVCAVYVMLVPLLLVPFGALTFLLYKALWNVYMRIFSPPRY